MTPADRLRAIAEDGVCIGCGICEAIAGPDVVRCVVTPTGYERPVVVGDLGDAAIDAIEAVCPGLRVTGAAPDDGARLDPVWGPWHRIVTAWAADPAVRHRGSTGGVLTAMGMHLLDTGAVDAVLHAGPSLEHPGLGEPRVSTTAAEVFEAAGSIYGPTAPLRLLDEALDNHRRLALIVKPCDLSAVALRAADDPRIAEQIRFRLTMVCGGIMAPEGLAERMGWFGLDPEAVTAIRYRGHGCPGDTRFELRDGTAIERTYLDFWGEDDSQWTIPYRCKVCPDGTGETADIAAADTWPGGSPTPEMLEGDPGTNAVIARTAAGRELLESAVESGHVAVGGPATVEELGIWQPHHVRKKTANWARQLGRRRAGHRPLELLDLRAEELARTQPVRVLLDEARGSRRRAQEAIEPPPVPADG